MIETIETQRVKYWAGGVSKYCYLLQQTRDDLERELVDGRVLYGSAQRQIDHVLQHQTFLEWERGASDTTEASERRMCECRDGISCASRH